MTISIEHLAFATAAIGFVVGLLFGFCCVLLIVFKSFLSKWMEGV